MREDASTKSTVFAASQVTSTAFAVFQFEQLVLFSRDDSELFYSGKTTTKAQPARKREIA